MAKLILETLTNGVAAYHKVEGFPCTIGRGYNNDIILPDFTISAQHAVLDETRDGIQFTNVSEENGSSVNKEHVEETCLISDFPAELRLGKFKARLLLPDTPVRETQLSECNTAWCLFASPLWSFLLITLTVGLFVLQDYLTLTAETEAIKVVLSVLPKVLILIGITVVLAGVSRLSIQRWELLLAIRFTTMLFAGYILIEFVSDYLNYWLTSNAPGNIINLIGRLFIVPLLLTLYLMRVNHSRMVPAILVSVLVSAPVLAFQLSEVVSFVSENTGFSHFADYSNTLSVNDIRLKQTISIDAFIDSVKEEMPTALQEKLDEDK